MISMTFTGPLLQRKLSFFTIHDRAKIRRVDSEEFRFVPRTCPSVWWQADCARAGDPLHCYAKENSP
jgi:hypothetical protein